MALFRCLLVLRVLLTHMSFYLSPCDFGPLCDFYSIIISKLGFLLRSPRNFVFLRFVNFVCLFGSVLSICINKLKAPTSFRVLTLRLDNQSCFPKILHQKISKVIFHHSFSLDFLVKVCFIIGIWISYT